MKTIKAFLYTACLIIAMAGAWNLYNMNQSTARTTELYEALAEAKPTTLPTEPDDVNAGYSPVENPWLQELKEQNSDLVGWLTVEGTNIDYPVMQNFKKEDFYLNHDFSKRRDGHGTPFLDADCRLSASENLIIYGHHMQDNTMFQNLMKFRSQAFCEAHGSIHLDTVEDSRDYQVVFVMVISAQEAQAFPYHQKINLSREADYLDFLEQCQQYAVWQGQQLPKPGTGLLTLSTCEYTKEDGRLVIVAQETA